MSLHVLSHPSLFVTHSSCCAFDSQVFRSHATAVRVCVFQRCCVLCSTLFDNLFMVQTCISTTLLRVLATPKTSVILDPCSCLEHGSSHGRVTQSCSVYSFPRICFSKLKCRRRRTSSSHAVVTRSEVHWPEHCLAKHQNSFLGSSARKSSKKNRRQQSSPKSSSDSVVHRFLPPSSATVVVRRWLSFAFSPPLLTD